MAWWQLLGLLPIEKTIRPLRYLHRHYVPFLTIAVIEFISTKAILKLKFRGDCFLKNLNDCCDNTKEWEAEENAPSRNSDACRGFDGNENSMERTGNAFRAIISLSGKTS